MEWVNSNLIRKIIIEKRHPNMQHCAIICVDQCRSESQWMLMCYRKMEYDKRIFQNKFNRTTHTLHSGIISNGVVMVCCETIENPFKQINLLY